MWYSKYDILTLWRPLLPYGYSYNDLRCPTCASPYRVKPSFVIFDNRALWRSALSVRVSGWRLNSVWHKMLYSCTHMATVGVKELSCRCNGIVVIITRYTNYKFETCMGEFDSSDDKWPSIGQYWDDGVISAYNLSTDIELNWTSVRRRLWQFHYSTSTDIWHTHVTLVYRRRTPWYLAVSRTAKRLGNSGIKQFRSAWLVCEIPGSRINVWRLTPTVAILVQLQSILCQTGLSRSFAGHSDAQGWASECPDVNNYKWPA